jgi:hypothetical protein
LGFTSNSSKKIYPANFKDSFLPKPFYFISFEIHCGILFEVFSSFTETIHHETECKNLLAAFLWRIYCLYIIDIARKLGNVWPNAITKEIGKSKHITGH